MSRPDWVYSLEDAIEQASEQVELCEFMERLGLALEGSSFLQKDALDAAERQGRR